MNEHVPGIDGVYLQQQAEVLKKKLAGHKLFAKWRGRFAYSLHDLAKEDLIGDIATLSQIDKKSRETLGEYMALIRILAGLKLAGNEMAYEEMLSALQDGEYRMIGENIPFEKTIPVTIAIFKPEVMLQILQWLVRDDKMFELDTLLVPEKSKVRDSVKESTRHLLQLIPSLGYRNIPHPHFWNGELYLAIFQDILKDFFAEASEWHKKLDVLGLLYPHSFGQNFEMAGPERSEEREGCYKSAIAFTFKGEQSDFLKLFSRKKQDQIATWQVHFPEAVWDNGYYGVRKIGVHPAKEHEMWKKLFPQYCSIGTNAGTGIVTIPDDRYINYAKKKVSGDPEQKEIRAILSV